MGDDVTMCTIFGRSASAKSKDGNIVSGDRLSFFKERRGAVAACGEAVWEKVTLTVDSGASDIVVPAQCSDLQHW